MMQPGDRQIPDTSTAWQLWYSDTFDRDALPSLELQGVNILDGLYHLWLYTLNEGILENGTASFSRFHLTWGNTASTRADVFVTPFDNSSLRKLRQWAGFTSRTEETRVETGLFDKAQSEAVLRRLAQRHYELLQASDRWQAGTIRWSAESKELLEQVEKMTSPEEL